MSLIEVFRLYFLSTKAGKYAKGFLFFIFLLSFMIPASSFSTEKDKTVFSLLMHCYPYNRDYSDRVDYADRPLEWDLRLTAEEAIELKMLRMQEAGIDVCAQTLFYANGRPPVGGDTTTALLTFERSLDACNGTAAKVVPEICAISRAAQHGTADLVDFFRKMIETYGDHPQWFRYQGKLAVFLWNPFEDYYGPSKKFGPEQLEVVWKELGSDLRSKLYVVDETYYMVRRPDDYAVQHWNREGYIDELLSVADNLFWWYSWSDAASEKLRAHLLADTLRSKTDAPIAVGIRPGYYRKNLGVINPHEVTAKFRKLWDADLSVNPDWVYFYSLDDYSENGQIEPTRLNRGAYSALARTMTSAWKGSAEKLPAQIWTGYPLCVMRGQNMQAEVFQLNTTSVYSQVSFALEDINGQELYRSAPVAAQQGYGAVQVFPFTIPTTNQVFDGQQAVVPVVYTEGEEGSQIRRGLSPIRLTRHHPTNPLYQFYRLDRLKKPTELSFSYNSITGDAQCVTGAFSIRNDSAPFRRVELRDLNDRVIPFSSDLIAQLDKLPSAAADEHEQTWFAGLSEDRTSPFYLPLSQPTNCLTGHFSFKTGDIHDAAGMSYLFVEYADGTTWSSKPRLIDWTKKTAQTTVFDLSDSEVWKPIGSEALPAEDTVIGDWDFSDYNTNRLYAGSAFIPDRGLYGFPLYLGYGPNRRTYRDSEAKHPSFDAKNKSFVFSGQEQVLRLADFVFPPGAFSAEFEVKPEGRIQNQWLLWHKRGAANVQLLTNGHVLFSRGEKENQVSLQSRGRLKAGEWNRIRVGDDGQRLFIYINGNLDSVTLHKPLKLIEPVSTWSDLILIGGSTSEGFFKGEMRRVSLLDSVPDLSDRQEKYLPSDFQAEFENGLDHSVWNVSEPQNTSVIVTNSELVLEDRTTSWGEGAEIETCLKYAATGQSFRVSAQIMKSDADIKQGTLVEIGFSKNACLQYWFNIEKMQVQLIMNGETVWKSNLWRHGNLIKPGDHIGVELSPSGWRVVRSSNGNVWSTLTAGGATAEGQFDGAAVPRFSEPLTVRVKNAKSGPSGSSIVVDQLRISALQPQ